MEFRERLRAIARACGESERLFPLWIGTIADAVVQVVRGLPPAARGIGCTFEEPLLQLAFLPLPVIPHLKLTDRLRRSMPRRRPQAARRLRGTAPA
jgi:hypothetical protein